MIPLSLLVVGLLLIFLEFYLPGAILGITGGMLVFASAVVFATDNPNLLWILLYLFGISVAVSLTIKFAMWKIRTAKPEHSIYSASAQEGFQASSYDKSAIGKTGIVLTDLKPGGHILVEGKRLQAISQSGYITKGTEVEIVDGQGESLLVIKRKDLK